MTSTNQNSDLLVLTSNIVTAHVGRNHVPTEALPQLITDVFNTLRGLQNGAGLAGRAAARDVAAQDVAAVAAKAPEHGAAKPMTGTREGETKTFPGLRAPNNPAVDPALSIQPDFLVCIESGEKFKTLKRHLASEYNMTPEQYREKWNLPSDYPMVAPNYSAVRSHLAKESRLGGSAPRAAAAPAKPPEPVAAEPAASPAAKKPVAARPVQAKKKLSSRR